MFYVIRKEVIAVNQRTRLTKALLRQAMLRQLETKGVDRVTVVGLCQDAGINRSTFYRYYSAPGDVVQDLQQSILEDIRQIMARIDPGSEVTYLRQMDAVFDYLYQNRRSIRLLLSSMDFGLQLLESTMQTAGLMKRQALRMDETDRQMAATMLLHGGYSLVRQWLMAEEPMPPLEFSQRMRTVLRSLYL